MGHLGIEFGMSDVLSVVFGICWVFLHYFLGEILSFWDLKHLDYFYMCDLGCSRVLPVYNLVFFDLVNSFHLLISGHLVDFPKIPCLEYYSNILLLYLYLGWLAPESILKVGNFVTVMSLWSLLIIPILSWFYYGVLKPVFTL